MGALVEPLAWDTEFFGFPIGRVSLDGLDAASLVAVGDEARTHGLACLYGTLDPAEETAAFVAQRAGFRLVEVAITFARPAAPFTPPPTRSQVRAATDADLPRLEPAVHTLAPFSRYACDPRFGPDAARRMHRAWVERALRDHDRVLFVAEDESGITGVSTCVRGDVPRVDITGVTKPGSGAADALMAAFFDWADGGDTEAGPCAARNVAVLRYVERCGFRAARVQYLFHRWLDEDTEALP